GRLAQVLDANNNPTTATYDSLGHMISLNNRDSGLIEYHYSAAGDLGAKVTPNLRAASPSQRIRYVHDRHRLTEVQYPDGRLVGLAYGGPGAWGNSAGRLQYRSDDSGSTWFAYGALGETTDTWRYLRPAGNQSYWTWVSTQFVSDAFGRQRSVTYNDGEVVNYLYDRGGNLQRVTGTPSGGSTRDYLSFVGYDAYGQRSRVMLGNGTETRYQRDPLMQRLTHVDTDGPGGAAIQRLFYKYNESGNITQRRQELTSVMGSPFGAHVEQAFSYDHLGQLTGASGYYQESATHERRYTLSMAYDGIGNITQNTQTDVRALLGGGSPVPVSATSHALSYAYQQLGSTRPHAATTVGTRSFTFDPNGNQLGWLDSATNAKRELLWDEDDRLESVTTDGATVNFLYDGAGERTHKWSSGGTSIYANAYWSVRNGVQTTKHVYASGQRIASLVTDPVSGTEEHWFHTDHLGSTQFVSDASGAVREHHEGLPFGEPWIEESSASDTTPFRFTGKELDSETGLQYFGARYYDPRQAQWASVDPIVTEPTILSLALTHPQHLWGYSQSANSPVVLRDPDGRCWGAIIYGGFMAAGFYAVMTSHSCSDGPTPTGLAGAFAGGATAGGAGAVLSGAGGASMSLGRGMAVGGFSSLAGTTASTLVTSQRLPSAGEAALSLASGAAIGGAIQLRTARQVSSAGESSTNRTPAASMPAAVARTGTPVHPIEEVALDSLTALHPVPRAEQPPNHIEDIMQNIQSNGYNRGLAILVLRMPRGELLIGGGHHRAEAMRRLGETTIPARVVNWFATPTRFRESYLKEFGDVIRRFLPNE
ncbi:MAG: RHS repeat-associated core domain-containing protein, partial [Deltaproteobacteria bacterium]|nr:RHS repeat-associated core domain-containing protein [Deltaproteobacteria bacterium]